MKITSSGLFAKMSKIAVFFIIISFLISPLAPVFAQEAEIGTPPAEQGNSVPVPQGQVLGEAAETPLEETIAPATEPLPIEETLPVEEESKKEEVPIEEEPEAMSMLTGSVGAPGSLTLSPDTRTSLSPNIDDLDGSLVYEYSIKVPPGRNEVTTPKISLVYNSKYANNESVIGSGWSVNIPSIERINKKGTNTMYTDDYFYSSLDGELVSLGSGSYAAKVEKGNFLKYTLASNVWTVIDKQGTVYKFGTAAASRQDDPGDSSRIFKWMLEEVRDTNDNYISYTYYKDAGQIYPSQIVYSGNGSTAGVLEETGIKIKNLQKGIFTNDIFSPDKHYVTLFMVSDYESGEVQTLEPEKCEGWEWFAWDNLPAPLFLPFENLLKENFDPFNP